MDEQDRLLWEAEVAMENAFNLVGRNQFVDYLSPKNRELLFSDYVLKEHYDCLAHKYDILKMSSNIQQQVIQETWIFLRQDTCLHLS